MNTFLVGGAVRDKLLGLDPKDLDYVVVGSTPEQMLQKGYKQVGADFPVFLHPETNDEYALARIERKQGVGYHGFVCNFENSVTLEDDLGRRDLTINSMAMDDNGAIVDPYNGQEDLKNKVLKHTTAAFAEDPLRVLRICRFAARYQEFEIHSDTLELMKSMVENGEVDNLTKERVWLELEKTLTEPKPSRFFKYLHKVGALQKLFPELAEMDGVPQRADFHAEGDVLVHTLMVLDKAAELCSSKNLNKSDTVEVVASALWHDVGKAKTPHELLYHEDGSEKGFHHGHDDTEIIMPILDQVRENLKMPNNVFKIVKDVALLHQKIHGLSKMSAKGIVRMFNQYAFKNKGKETYLNKVLLSCHADSLGRLMTVKDVVVEPPQDYPQHEEVIKLFKLYSDVNIKPWMDEYQEKNEIRPSTDKVVTELHRLRLNVIKKHLQSGKKSKLKP
jgi:tRNA nucleotidyltransferase (CCA-adding enzyme)